MEINKDPGKAGK